MIAVDPFLDADFGVLRRDDALENDRHLDELADFVDVFPAVPEAPVRHAVFRDRRELPDARLAGTGCWNGRTGCQSRRRGSRRGVATAASTPAAAARLHHTAEMAIVQIALVDRRLLIDRDDDRLGAQVLEHLKLFGRRAKIGNRIELLPSRAGRRRRDLLMRYRRPAGERGERVGRSGAAIHADFAVGMQRALAGARRGENRELHRHAENHRRHVDRRRIDRLARDDIDPVERLTIAAQVRLAAVAVRHIVVRLERHVAIAERFEIECVDQLVDARNPFMSDEAVRIDLRLQQRGCRKHPGEAGKRPPPAQTEPPTVLDHSHEEPPEIVLLGGQTYNSPVRTMN